MAAVYLLEQVINGLLSGGYYLLIALGLSMIFSLGGIVNLAHGAFYAIGAYFAIEISALWGFGSAIIISPVLVGLIGIAFDRSILRRFYSADPIISLLLTFGLSMVIEQLIRMAWGAAPLASSIPTALRGNIVVGEFLYSRYRLIILGAVILLLVAIWFLLNRTSFGRVVRAGVQKPDMVAALGIKLVSCLQRLLALCFLLLSECIPLWGPKS
jgi:branched-chain amino acid transport system permease protein